MQQAASVHWVRFFLCCLLASHMLSVVQASESLRLPISIKGFQLPADWQSASYADWQFLVFKQQDWQALTFQIDEMDAQGQVKTDIAYHTGRFQAQDELLLLWDELSPQAWPGFAAVQASQNWLELIVESPVLGKRYGYVYRQAHPQWTKPSTQDFVQFDVSKRQVRSEFLQIEYAADDFTQVNAIRLRTLLLTKNERIAKNERATSAERKDFGPSILQGVHASFATGVLYKGVRLQLNDQQHIQASLLGVKDGPLRVALRLNLAIRYVGMNLYDSALMIHHYPNAVNLPSRFVGSSIKALDRFSWLLKQPEISLRLTLQDVMGAQVVIEDAQQLLNARVDGQLTEAEKRLRRPPGRWLSVRAHGWQALLNNTLPPTQGGLLQQYLQGTSAIFWYDEAASTLTVGADIQGLPKSAVQLLALLAQLPPVVGDDLQSWLRHWIELGQAGKLKPLNQLHQSVWQAWIKKLKRQSKSVVLTPEQLANWLMLDLQLTGFVGYDPVALQSLLATALRQSADWQRLDLLIFLQAVQRLADKHQVDLRRVQYRPLDNTLWFAEASQAVNPVLAAQQFADQVHPQWWVVAR